LDDTDVSSGTANTEAVAAADSASSVRRSDYLGACDVGNIRIAGLVFSQFDLTLIGSFQRPQFLMMFSRYFGVLYMMDAAFGAAPDSNVVPTGLGKRFMIEQA
jgi:hypothetical protein